MTPDRDTEKLFGNESDVLGHRCVTGSAVLPARPWSSRCREVAARRFLLGAEVERPHAGAVLRGVRLRGEQHLAASPVRRAVSPRFRHSLPPRQTQRAGVMPGLSKLPLEAKVAMATGLVFFSMLVSRSVLSARIPEGTRAKLFRLQFLLFVNSLMLIGSVRIWKRVAVGLCRWRGESCLTHCWKLAVLLFLTSAHSSFLTLLVLVSEEPSWIGLVTYTCLGSYVILLFFLFVFGWLDQARKLLAGSRSAASQAPGAADRHPKRKDVLAIGVTLALTVLGLLNGAQPPAVVRVEIPVHKLPPSFDNAKLVLLSDIHLGPTVGKSRLEMIVSMVNQLQPGEDGPGAAGLLGHGGDCGRPDGLPGGPSSDCDGASAPHEVQAGHLLRHRQPRVLHRGCGPLVQPPQDAERAAPPQRERPGRAARVQRGVVLPGRCGRPGGLCVTVPRAWHGLGKGAVGMQHGESHHPPGPSAPRRQEGTTGAPGHQPGTLRTHPCRPDLPPQHPGLPLEPFLRWPVPRGRQQLRVRDPRHRVLRRAHAHRQQSRDHGDHPQVAFGTRHQHRRTRRESFLIFVNT
nr:PREDICTED: transmembrane protein with metallophosphoesterase domain isoform X1 [Lepisosteus oculatus]